MLSLPAGGYRVRKATGPGVRREIELCYRGIPSRYMVRLWPGTADADTPETAYAPDWASDQGERYDHHHRDRRGRVSHLHVRARGRHPVQPVPRPRRGTPAVPHRNAVDLPRGPRGGRQGDRPGESALDRLQPFRAGRVRVPQSLARGGAGRGRREQPRGRDGVPGRLCRAPAARRFHFCATPHLPHGWDAAMLFEETERVLFCSDLLHQLGDVEAATGNSVTERFRETLTNYQQGPMAQYMPWTPHTGTHLARLAALNPRVCATMHGAAYEGDGAQAMTEVGEVMREVYAPV